MCVSMYPVYLFLFNEMSCLYLHAPLACYELPRRSVGPSARTTSSSAKSNRATVITWSEHGDENIFCKSCGSLFGRSFLISCSLDWYTNTNHHCCKEGGPIKFSTNQRVVNNRQRVGFWVLRMGVGNIDAVVTTRDCLCVRSSCLFPRYGTDGDMHPRVSIDRSLSH